MKLCHNKKYAFDFDGTLVECQAKQLYLYAKALRIFGFRDFDPSSFWLMKSSGMNTKDCLMHQCADEEILSSAMLYWFNEIENLEYQIFDRPTDLLLKIVKHIEKPIVITARRNPCNLRIQVNNLQSFLSSPQLFIVDHENAIASKAKILGELEVDIFFGDSEIDMYAAKLANVDFQFVEGGQRTLECLKSL